MMLTDKLRLEPTAALVMQWALKLYTEDTVLQYVNQLDLSSGEALLKECNSVCDWYDEVILNRKNFIKYLIDQELSAAKQEFQLIFLAAGKSPSSVEILYTNPHKIHRIFEVDSSGMEDKKRLYLQVCPELTDKLRCVTADITSPDILSVLDMPVNGYRHDMKSIIIMEGISYYLHKNDLQNIITRFRTDRENLFIIEYMIPYRYVNPARRQIPEEIFKIIQDSCGLSAVTSYTKNELRTLFLKNRGDLIAGYSMADMELNRTGANAYFEKPSDGWIECAIGRIGTLPA
ncbi:MAG: class I SAM-dependent methyltransferase [Dehalococcoidales bacterium]|nr:class I SAM-dependent methyltransferase [Dehalococcoidales bacterium]